MSKLFERPSSLQILTSATTSEASFDFVGASKQVTVRVPLNDMCFVDAISEKTSLSRNRVISLLLEAGLDSYLAQLEASDVKAFESIAELYSGNIESALDSGDFERGI